VPWLGTDHGAVLLTSDYKFDQTLSTAPAGVSPG
jgi:hypothetical protein